MKNKIFFLIILFANQINCRCPDAEYVCTYHVDDANEVIIENKSVEGESSFTKMYRKDYKPVPPTGHVREQKKSYTVECGGDTSCYPNPFNLKDIHEDCFNKLHGKLSVIRECAFEWTAATAPTEGQEKIESNQANTSPDQEKVGPEQMKNITAK